MPVTSAQVWTFFWLHVGTILVVTAYFALAAAIWPQATTRAAMRFGRRWWLALVIGLLISLPLVGAIIALSAAGIQQVAAVIFLGWLLCGLFGGAGIAVHVGRHGRADVPDSHAALRGGLMLTLSWALPVIGWFFMLPLTIAAGVGCLVLGWVPMKTDTTMTERNEQLPVGGQDESGFAFAQREEGF